MGIMVAAVGKGPRHVRNARQSSLRSYVTFCYPSEIIEDEAITIS